MNSRRINNVNLNSSEDWLIEHAHRPYHQEQISKATHSATLTSAHCSDIVFLQLVVDDRVIKQACHTAQGCLIGQASASFICKLSEGKHFEQLQTIKETEYLTLLGPLTPMRQQCALLAFRCLQKALVTS